MRSIMVGPKFCGANWFEAINSVELQAEPEFQFSKFLEISTELEVWF